ncbi:MAG: FKBP-type peptidyl-prolyl cis-trans isomerase [Gammaproteobacteria bacterium]|nr:FKBP-type peptidyl-prolyl cis-trans isomerase [Gammaproteobacteria bacterium]
MSKNLYLVVAAVLVGFYFLQTFTPSLSEEELEAHKQASLDYLAANQFMGGVKVTESGLQYEVLQSGTGTVHPKVSDMVTVHYDGSLVDGTVFDSSVARGEPITFGLGRVIAGWKEGLPLMVVGDKMRFFIPPSLAYGEKWAGKIPPNSTLIFDVELLKIN